MLKSAPFIRDGDVWVPYTRGKERTIILVSWDGENYWVENSRVLKTGKVKISKMKLSQFHAWRRSNGAKLKSG